MADEEPGTKPNKEDTDASKIADAFAWLGASASVSIHHILGQ